ncbi:MAG: hypothetical protein HYZ28_03595 [Myxococcales bacterium]|nr:hypothetical protein [Myxococcales bacterium]
MAARGLPPAVGDLEAPASAGPVELRPGERKLKVVITGYGDFGGTYDEAAGRPNPSGVLAKKLAELGLKNADVEFRKLEVTHGAVESFLRDMERARPDVIISMGVSGGQAQVEERPQNWKGGGTDGRNQPIEEGPISRTVAPRARMETDLPVDAIDKALTGSAGSLPNGRTVGTDDRSRSGRDEEYFPDDSAYLCNYLNYRLTETFGRDERVTAGFVHINGDSPGRPGTTAEEMRVLAQAVVDRQVLKLRELDAPRS